MRYYKKKNFCRCCLNKNLFLYLNLGQQPLANSYHKGEILKKFPLEVYLCLNCFHSQLSVVVDPDLMYKNYLYVSGTTSTFRKHTKELAQDAVKRFGRKNLSVLDIACNDGTQLEFFRQIGCKVKGIDPAQNLREITKKKHIPVKVAYWNIDIAKKIKNQYDIITATNVFAHVDDIENFLNACKIALKPNGLIIIEFPYAVNMVANNEFDTVYHEHLSYFLVNSFNILIKRLDLVISDIVRTSIHGGSIRFFVSKNSRLETNKVKELISLEKELGLLKKSTYMNFSKNVKQNKIEMKILINKLKKENKKIIGYGASAKGNTMMNYFKIDLSYLIDENELKQGYYTPGRNILIKSLYDLQNEPKDLFVVILAWNFYNEIIQKINKIRLSNNDFAVLYVPKIKILKIGSIRKYKYSA
jgi:SAM-dependent methyltransferase